MSSADKPKTHDTLPARRDFMRLALGAVPAGSLLASACYADAALEAEPEEQALSTPNDDGCADIDAQRTRWVQLHDAYVGLKNAHDLPGIVACFRSDGELVLNDLPAFIGADAIAEGSRLFGLSSEPSGLDSTQFFPQREFFLSDKLLVEGRVFATHVGTVLGYPPTQRSIEMQYAALYRFDNEGKLVSEHTTMNWGPLADNS